MSDEIEEFIRRAAERRKQTQGQGQRKPATRPQESQPQPAQQRPRPRLAQPEVVEAEIVSAEVVEHVSGYVAQHLSSQQFTERASHLGEETALADDKMEAHLHQKFDHQIGRLAPSTLDKQSAAATAGAAPTVSYISSSADLANLLRSPQSIRNAIILSEILNRPEHLW